MTKITSPQIVRVGPDTRLACATKHGGSYTHLKVGSDKETGEPFAYAVGVMIAAGPRLHPDPIPFNFAFDVVEFDRKFYALVDDRRLDYPRMVRLSGGRVQIEQHLLSGGTVAELVAWAA
ncbi:hypothetical protein [Branchiibius sp. NY16-3462-2]|uniref:hypothetical protein n=1 Tax=Branchiibius sp. NY16-3462-2 TaxID=1807500 RepID=UPI00079C6683|nr:hypothetical protein [Branchiibius sp. NY16-3462-2]KYH44786.1 hypothetical protein AZH51_12225 [Branchiibius sp. NY16-3462-2]